MKTPFKYLLASMVAFVFVFNFSACGGDDETVITDDGNTITTGDIQILVKKKGNPSTFNNYACLAVLSKNKESMNFFTYKTGKLELFEKPKVYLENFEQNIADENLIDTFYTRKGAGINPDNSEKTGALNITGLEPGIYFLHIFDANRNKALLEVEVTTATGDDLFIAETQKLGNLKVQVVYSTIAGNEVDDADVRVYGYNTDTLQAVLTGNNPSDIKIAPYYTGTTSTMTNENGNEQKGIVYFFNLPVRTFYVAAYKQPWSQTNQDQAIESAKIEQNLMTIKSLNLQ